MKILIALLKAPQENVRLGGLGCKKKFAEIIQR
jgi:hypothetical protein